jgi:hypothetical protein
MGGQGTHAMNRLPDDELQRWLHEDAPYGCGRLPDGLKPADLRRNHPSLPANPDIAQVLYLRGLMERIGRGTQKIIQSCVDQGLRPPPMGRPRDGGHAQAVGARRCIGWAGVSQRPTAGAAGRDEGR